MASQLPGKKIKNNNNNWPMWSPVVLRQVVAVEMYARDTGKHDSAEDRGNLNNRNRMEQLKQITEHRNRYLLTTKKIFTTSWSTFLPEMLWRPQHLHPSASRRSKQPSVDRGFRVSWVLLHQTNSKKNTEIPTTDQEHSLSHWSQGTSSVHPLSSCLLSSQDIWIKGAAPCSDHLHLRNMGKTAFPPDVPRPHKQ